MPWIEDFVKLQYEGTLSSRGILLSRKAKSEKEFRLTSLLLLPMERERQEIGTSQTPRCYQIHVNCLPPDMSRSWPHHGAELKVYTTQASCWCNQAFHVSPMMPCHQCLILSVSTPLLVMHFSNLPDKQHCNTHRSIAAGSWWNYRLTKSRVVTGELQ